MSISILASCHEMHNTIIIEVTIVGMVMMPCRYMAVNGLDAYQQTAYRIVLS